MAYGRQKIARIARDIEKWVPPTVNPISIFFSKIAFIGNEEGEIVPIYESFHGPSYKWAYGRLARHLGIKNGMNDDPIEWLREPGRTVGEVVAKLRASAGIGYWGAGIQ